MAPCAGAAAAAKTVLPLRPAKKEVPLDYSAFPLAQGDGADCANVTATHNTINSISSPMAKERQKCE